jgi:hypothetical protein
MEAICSAGTLVEFKWATWRFTAEDSILVTTSVRASNRTSVDPLLILLKSFCSKVQST